MNELISVILTALNLPDKQEFITVCIRISCAVIVGMVIGLERERYFANSNYAQAAGFRTYTMVMLGSCLFAIASIYGFASHIPSQAGVIVDPGRVVAQVVTGMGFLGGGAILVHKGKIRGLTTAAGLWVSAAIGLLFGAGLIIYGLVAALFAYFLLDFHRIVPKWFQKQDEEVTKPDEE